MQGDALKEEISITITILSLSGFLLPSALGADTLCDTDLSSHMLYFSCLPHTLVLCVYCSVLILNTLTRVEARSNQINIMINNKIE